MTDEEVTAWIEFLSALENIQTNDRRSDRVEFLKSYRSETVLLSVWLNKLKVVGGKNDIASSPPTHCDLCGVDLSTNSLFIDGQTRSTLWSFMCLPCFGNEGIGVGWGIGQLFKLEGKDTTGTPRWVCIAGGNPDPDSDSEGLIA